MDSADVWAAVCAAEARLQNELAALNGEQAAAMARADELIEQAAELECTLDMVSVVLRDPAEATLTGLRETLAAIQHRHPEIAVGH